MRDTSNSADDMQSPELERLLTDREAEGLLNVHHGYLPKDRVGTARIPFVKIGRSVRYRPSDIRNFIASNLRKSTSDTAGG